MGIEDDDTEAVDDIERMAALLAARLSKQELIDLFVMLDEDDGPLFDAIGDLVARIAPEIFSN